MSRIILQWQLRAYKRGSLHTAKEGNEGLERLKSFDTYLAHLFAKASNSPRSLQDMAMEKVPAGELYKHHQFK